MADPVGVAERQHAHQFGAALSLLTLPFRVFGVLCGSLLLSIGIECLGMYFFWPAEGWQHARSMLNHEIDQLSSYFTQSLFLRAPGHAAYLLINRTYDALFVRSGTLEWMNQSTQTTRQPLTFQHFLHQAYVSIEPYAIVTCYTCLTFFVRLVVLCLTAPLFIVTAFIGFIDGLVRRDLRRFGAERESSFLHHRAKATVIPLAVFPWVFYLTLPISVHPLFVLFPAALLLGVAVNLTATTFKKYL